MEKEFVSSVLQDTSQINHANYGFFFFLQKEEQILFILDHKEAYPSLPHSSKRNSYVLDIFQKIAYTHIYVFCWIGFF